MPNLMDLLVEGWNVKDAVKEAGKIRLRPIILTSLTTTIGLFPMLFEKSVQAQFLIPMAISLAYGVFLGTIFILIFFPVLIMLLNDARVYVQLFLDRCKTHPGRSGNRHDPGKQEDGDLKRTVVNSNPT